VFKTGNLNIMAKKPPVEKEYTYSYCRVSKSKFIIMEKKTYGPNSWYEMGTASIETRAQEIVTALNAA
jgi:hypothetical protein